MWFEDKAKFKNLDDAILRVINGQSEEPSEVVSDDPIQQEEPSSNDQAVLKEEEVEINEKSKYDYQIYHDSYSSAVQHAVDHTKKAHGYDVDQDSYER